ncbi:tetratricopeptide repeat protein [Hymenobacter sp. 5516J-16]|nr:tetratricopeptide repeat protein [Hymenobacter sp. 5516J-16]UOQ76357.1 tetratricopeptide repeat protein [Hymenobacter sp. 5516J-16]
MKAPILSLATCLTLLFLTDCARTTTEVERPTSAARNAARETSVAQAADSAARPAAGVNATVSTAPTPPLPVEPAARKSNADYRADIRTADLALKAKPRDFDALLARAKAKSHLKDYREAVIDYNAALRLKPTNAEAYYNRGLNRLKLKEYSAAIVDFGKAVKYNPRTRKLISAAELLKCRCSTSRAPFRISPKPSASTPITLMPTSTGASVTLPSTSPPKPKQIWKKPPNSTRKLKRAYAATQGSSEVVI